MTKKEFEELCEEVSQLLIKEFHLWQRYVGACEALYIVGTGDTDLYHETEIVKMFNKRMRPADAEGCTYWLGETTAANRSKRLDYFNRFRAICLSEKLYKDF